MLENRPPLKLKNNATSFSDIFQSEQNWASYGVFFKTDDAPTMLGYRTPFSFCLYTFLSSIHSREQGPQSSVCTPVQHTVWLDQLYYFILVSLVVVFVAVYNATSTTWGKLQHNFRNILSCGDQSQGSILGTTHTHTYWRSNSNNRSALRLFD